ncbi:MAG: hypothetical protein PHU56_01835 [Candidatus Pacebacteria bacterium]|nr:hypothetical protein [Candidatus Paceibacterota bacterium]
MKNNIWLIPFSLLVVVSGGLFLPQICQANTVVGFMISYPPLFLAVSFVAVVIIEAAELKKRLGLFPNKSVLVSLAVNAASSLVGLIVGYLLKADILKSLANAAGWLVVLFLGSFLMEAFIMMLFGTAQGRAKIWQTSLIMNLISYLFLILFAILDIFLFAWFIILALIVEKLFSVFGWARNWSKAKAFLVKFLIFVLACLAVFLSLIFLAPKDDTNAKAKDTRVILEMNRTRAIMDFIYAEYGDYDRLQYTYPDIEPLIYEVQRNSYLNRRLIITHFPLVSSSAVCMFAPLNKEKGRTWYCIDSQGNAGIVDKNPYDSVYCREGQSVKCPPIIEPLD